MDSPSPLSKGSADKYPKEMMEKVVNNWIEVTKIPSISSGYLFEDKNSLNITSYWSQNDPSKKADESFLRNFAIPKNLLNWTNNNGSQEIDLSSEVISFESIPVNIKFQCISKDGSKRAILSGGKTGGPGDGKSGAEEEFIQIWNKDSLWKTYNLKELDKHKTPSGVYTKQAAFGKCFSFSPDMKKIAYLAEKKVAPTKPFFTSFVKTKEKDEKKDDNGNDNPKPKVGEEYGYKSNWGEQLKDFSQSVIVILDTETDEFKILSTPEDVFLTDIQWTNDNGSIIGAAVTHQAWSYGFIYCSNRESRIFQVNLESEKFEFLSKEGVGSYSPRTNGAYIIWQERKIKSDDGSHHPIAPHRSAYALMGLDLKQSDPKPKILYELNPSNGFPLYGDLPLNCFHPTNSKRFFTMTINEAKIYILEFRFESNDKLKVSVIQEPSDINNILWISENFMLVSASCAISAPYLKLVSISDESNATKKNSVKVTTGQDMGEKIRENMIKFIPGSSASTPASILILPKDSNKNAPLIVYPHGGPHSSIANSYNNEIIFLLQLGFAVLKLNYIGSLGTKTDTTQLLLGKIGDLDVKDCQNTVNTVIAQEKGFINSNKVVVWGGSHGGFLAAHLSCSYPDIYQACVMHNPVTDLTTMIGTSDICDWVYSECGLEPEKNLSTLLPTSGSVENFKKLFDASPINKVGQLKAPTLLLLGSTDLRVPISQGMNYYRALIAHKKEADVRVYEDNHPLGIAYVQLDHICHTGLWFLKHCNMSL